MIRYYLFFVLAFQMLLINKSYAQQDDPKPLCIHKGNVTISGAYGVPSIVRLFLKVKTNRDQLQVMGFGPMMYKIDYMVSNKLSVGINFAYNFSRVSWMDDGYDTAIHAKRPYEYGIEMEEFSAGIRANYHFKRTSKFDLYAGAGVGYGRVGLGTYTEAPINSFSVGYNVPKPYSLEATAGCRYYFHKHMGVFGELGLGKSWVLLKKYFLPEALVQLGVNLKF